MYKLQKNCFLKVSHLVFPPCTVTMVSPKSNSSFSFNKIMDIEEGQSQKTTTGVRFHYKYSGEAIYSSHHCLISVCNAQRDNYRVKIKFLTIQRVIVPIFSLLIILGLISDLSNSLWTATFNMTLLIVVQHFVTYCWISSIIVKIKKSLSKDLGLLAIS